MLERIIKQRTQLILSQPFFGVLLMRLKIAEDASCKTFWVDGESLGFNPAYVETLSDLELRGCLAHEVLHPANGHCWRRGARDPKRWNRACDYAINPLVLSAGLKLPVGVLIDGRFLGKSAEEIYAILRQGDRQAPKPDAEGAGDGAGDASVPNGSPSNGGGGPDSGNPFEPGEVRQGPPTAQPGLPDEWRVATLQAEKVARMRGQLSGDLQAMVGEATKPPVDWRSILHRFASESSTTDYSWALPNRRYTHMGLYMPALDSRAVGDAVFVRDSSGSVFDETQAQFAAEIECMWDRLQPARLIVIDCDAAVRQVQIFERGDALDLAPVRGGGGTLFSPPFEWLAEQAVQPAFLVYLTDLDGAFPAPPAFPTLWASTTPLKRCKSPPFGECVEVVV